MVLLFQECIHLGVLAGCNRATVIISNQYSGSLYKNLGFETAKIVDLKKLGSEYKGRPLDIDNMNGNVTVYSMFKQGLP